jgi:hypothetical protein
MKHFIRNLLIAPSIIAAFAFALPSSYATMILLDFGRPDNTSSSSYNNITIPVSGPTATTGIIPLLDTGAVATGWSISVTDNGNGNSGNAGAGADITTVPAAITGLEQTAYQDSIFANGSNPGMLVSFTGLNDSLTYDFLFYGSRNNGQNAPDQTWHLTQGSGGTDVVHASLLNTTTVVDWPGLSTNGSGEITFTISGANGGALALNAGSISSIPEPSSLGLILAGTLLLARRFRSQKMA